MLIHTNRLKWTVVITLFLGCGTEPEKQRLEYPPVVTIESPEMGSEYELGDEITFTGTVFDDNQAPETLTLVWNSDKDGILDENPADEQGVVSISTNVLSAGPHIISLTAIDEEQASVQDWIQIEIID